MKKHFPVIIEQDNDGVFIVECPVFQGCRSYGQTVEEAIENIQEAIAICIAEAEPAPQETMFVGVRDLEVASRVAHWIDILESFYYLFRLPNSAKKSSLKDWILRWAVRGGSNIRFVNQMVAHLQFVSSPATGMYLGGTCSSARCAA